MSEPTLAESLRRELAETFDDWPLDDPLEHQIPAAAGPAPPLRSVSPSWESVPNPDPVGDLSRAFLGIVQERVANARGAGFGPPPFSGLYDLYAAAKTVREGHRLTFAHVAPEEPSDVDDPVVVVEAGCEQPTSVSDVPLLGGG